MATNVTFDGNSLQTSNILSSDIDHGNPPDKNISIYPTSHGNRSTITNTNEQSRIITISGVLQGSSVADTDALIDTFKSYFIGRDKNLDIDYNGSTRRYIATLDNSNSQIPRPGGLKFAEFTLQFICSNPYGQDISPTTIVSATGRTAGAYTDSFTCGGSAEWQLPKITITITAITGGTGGTLRVGNLNTGQGVVMSRDFAAGDVIIIDSASKQVLVNGTEVDPGGAFPEFNPGSGANLIYSDNFTTRTFDYDAEYTKLYE